MYCRKCNGRVLLDRAYSTNYRLELSCIGCGTGWVLRWSNRLGAHLLKVNGDYLKATTVTR